MTTIDRDTNALALLAVFEERIVSALSCVGLDDPTADGALDRARELHGGMDDDELENFGAAVAWSEAADLLRTHFTLGSVHGHSGDLVAVAVSALDAAAEIEGAGSDLHDAALGASAFLRSFDREPVSPSDLIFLAGQAIERAEDTGAASIGSGIVEVRGENYAYSCMIPDVGSALRAAANSGVLR
jgi:hypothetical protein